jgi:DNA-binding transcriptional LysR family regulator
MVARAGGVTRASEKLYVSPPTVSGQLRELQEALEGEDARPLRAYRGSHRRGRTVYRYAADASRHSAPAPDRGSDGPRGPAVIVLSERAWALSRRDDARIGPVRWIATEQSISRLLPRRVQ